LKTGRLSYAPPFDRPYEWTLAGDSRLFSVMTTAAGLAEIKTYADGIALFKGYVVPLKGELDGNGDLIDVNGDARIDLADATTQAPTRLVRDAHRAGLFVRAFTFRNESRRLAADFNGDPAQELLLFYRQGVDAVITDFTDTAIAARQAYLVELGR
jgi:glycerophosphoryl diester phosphodiesterase